MVRVSWEEAKITLKIQAYIYVIFPLLPDFQPLLKEEGDEMCKKEKGMKIVVSFAGRELIQEVALMYR